MRASLRTIPQADPFTSDPVSLDQIRPGPRRTNVYVDSPRAVATPPIKPHLASHHHHPHPTHSQTLGGGGGGGGGTGPGTSPGLAHRVLPSIRSGSLGSSGGVRRVEGDSHGGSFRTTSSVLSSPPPSVVISQQPSSKKPVCTTLDKHSSDLEDSGIGIVGIHGHRGGGGGGGGGGDGELINGDHSNSVFIGAAGTNHGLGSGGANRGIICEKCHKCQCSDCTDNKPLPSHWCCGNACEISPEKVLDAVTCFCCVKAAMYHCGSDEDYNNPCGCCSSSHCMRRWTLMSVMAVCLPCLWAYWPARGCLAACTAAYNGCWRGRKGCNCQCNNSVMKLDPDTSSKSKSSVLSRGGGGGGGGGGGSGGTSGGVGGGGTSKNSQSRRLLLIDSDSSSTST